MVGTFSPFVILSIGVKAERNMPPIKQSPGTSIHEANKRFRDRTHRFYLPTSRQNRNSPWTIRLGPFRTSQQMFLMFLSVDSDSQFANATRTHCVFFERSVRTSAWVKRTRFHLGHSLRQPFGEKKQMPQFSGTWLYLVTALSTCFSAFSHRHPMSDFLASNSKGPGIWLCSISAAAEHLRCKLAFQDFHAVQTPQQAFHALSQLSLIFNQICQV